MPLDITRVQRRALYRRTLGGKLTVAGYAPQWLDGHRLEKTSQVTYKSFLKHIISGLGSITLEELEPSDIRGFLRKLEDKGLSTSSIGTIRGILREMCKTAVQDGLMESDPTAGIRLSPRRSRPMPHAPAALGCLTSWPTDAGLPGHLSLARPEAMPEWAGRRLVLE